MFYDNIFVIVVNKTSQTGQQELELRKYIQVLLRLHNISNTFHCYNVTEYSTAFI